jgi:hypothetical protein
MRKIKTYGSWLGEAARYDLEPERHTDPEMQKSIADSYIEQIERATGSKVALAEGSVSETDCDLYFDLEDGASIGIEVIYAPYGGLTKVSVSDRSSRYEKSFGKISRFGGNEYGKDKHYEDMEEPIYHMVRDIYRENGMAEIPYTHEIRLPEELFGNDPYFHYDSDEKGRHSVYFESEEAAKAWIASLKISASER